MSFTTISSKGQITLPSVIRKALDIKPNDKVEITLRDKEIVMKRVPSFRKLRGSIPGKKGSSEQSLEGAISRHVLGKDK